MPAAPGAAFDTTGLTIQRLLQDQKMLPGSSSVINKAGGGGTIAMSYLNLHAGDAHYLFVMTASVLTNHILGVSKDTVHRLFAGCDVVQRIPRLRRAPGFADQKRARLRRGAAQGSDALQHRGRHQPRRRAAHRHGPRAQGRGRRRQEAAYRRVQRECRIADRNARRPRGRRRVDGEQFRAARAGRQAARDRHRRRAGSKVLPTRRRGRSKASIPNTRAGAA